MSQVGEGHEAQGAAPQVLTFGSTTIGEILADRYQIESHIGDDTLGRQLYRGTDVVLRRPVTVVLRQPGGDAASEMLAAAVSASRVVHPHLVGVYDAIDEGDRAYVVREWIDGVSLREAVAEGPVDASRAVAIAWAVADAVAALHATGVVHGNVHPGTVMIAQDGRVMLADARADDAATQQGDVRAIGGVLYCALTGFWPHTEAGPAPVADGVYDEDVLVAPSQVRSGIPAPVDEVTVRLLDLSMEPPAAETVAADLAVVSEATDDGADEGSFGFAAFDNTAAPAGPTRATGRRLAVGVGALIALAIVGTIAATRIGGSGSDDGSARPSKTTTSTEKPSGQPHQITIPGSAVRIVDPKGGDRSETANAAATVDGDLNKGWLPNYYYQSNFGGLKVGMGVLLDLGTPQQVTNVQVVLSAPGSTLELRVGDSDPGNGKGSTETDDQILASFRRVDQPKTPEGPRVVFNGDDKPVRYVLVFLTKLPLKGDGTFQVEVQEISVNVR